MGFNERIKKEVRKLSHFSCCLCKNIGAEIHHIIPQEDGGADDLDNAAPLCPTCHELYGGNPRKRKIVREARDQWYKICEKRFAPSTDRLSELAQKIDDLEKNLKKTSHDIIKKLTKEEFAPSGKSKINKLPLSKVIERILCFNHILKTPNSESINITHELLFCTEGDPNSKNDQEYNQVRREFIEKFGSLVVYNFCAYLVYHAKIDWVKGVPEPELQKLLSASFVFMVMLLHHEDLDNDLKLEIGFTKKNELIGRMKKT